ncbi:hypothetical protein DNTS_008172 [Danionella cerebrum]|uniref:Uncharacterized protein n=1 Tax=Danionella cerebrum TaxID=2873325 RepID=A0A553PUY4_9TELE|nr:hypothetical protein DNTS_008172 [Danionella translucida]
MGKSVGRRGFDSSVQARGEGVDKKVSEALAAVAAVIRCSGGRQREARPDLLGANYKALPPSTTHTPLHSETLGDGGDRYVRGPFHCNTGTITTAA